MSHHSRPWSQFGLVVVLFGSAAVGCQQQNPPPAPVPVPAPVIQPNPQVPKLAIPRDGPEAEDPELLAQYKSKGWDLTTLPIAGNTRLVLQVRDNSKQLGGTLSPEECKMIARSKAVRGVLLWDVNCSDEGLKTIAGMPALEYISVRGKDVTDSGLKALTECKSLLEVSVGYCPQVTDTGIRELAAVPNLRSLFLQDLTLEWSSLAALSQTHSLRSLRLYHVGGLTDRAIAHLGKIPNLDRLSIDVRETRFTTAGLKALVNDRLPYSFEFDKSLIDDELFISLVAKGWLYGPTAPGNTWIVRKPATAAHVRELDLRKTKITDAGFKAVLVCTNATDLRLDDTDITDETLRTLQAFSKLEQLTLNQTKATAAGLEAMLDSISRYPLQFVEMEGCELTENSFKAFGQMTRLVRLELGQTNTKGAWLKHIAHLPNLNSLDLSETGFDDTAVRYVVTMSALESLELDNTKLTDAGFQEVLKLPKLEHLSVTKTKVTKEAFEKAKKDYPKIRITKIDYN